MIGDDFRGIGEHKVVAVVVGLVGVGVAAYGDCEVGLVY